MPSRRRRRCVSVPASRRRRGWRGVAAVASCPPSLRTETAATTAPAQIRPVSVHGRYVPSRCTAGTPHLGIWPVRPVSVHGPYAPSQYTAGMPQLSTWSVCPISVNGRYAPPRYMTTIAPTDISFFIYHDSSVENISKFVITLL